MGHKKNRAVMSPRTKMGNLQEDRMLRSLDKLADFQEFQAEILPALRNDLKAGFTAQELYEKYQALAAARTISIVMQDKDSAKALAASKDILDRTLGKAKERTEVTHKLERLPDEQLDSLLLSELESLNVLETKPTAKH